MENRKKELIAQAVIKVLVSRFESFPEDTTNNRNAPFHEAFLNAFSEQLNGRVSDIEDYISLSSWLHGLNTSLGESFFESVAHILSDGEKRDFRENRIFAIQQNIISEIMTDLKNGEKTPSLRRENALLFSSESRSGSKQAVSQFTADCFFENDTDVVAIELKSVRPNSGEMRGEKRKILEAKAVLKERFPNKNIKYFFGFPFDPTATSDIGSDKRRFMEYLVEAEKFIDPSEILIADELWSFLLGEPGAMREILDIINTIATPRFMDKYNSIQNKSSGYENILSEWYLFSARKIFDCQNTITGDRNRRILNQKIFNYKGIYNTKRDSLLQNIIE